MTRFRRRTGLPPRPIMVVAPAFLVLLVPFFLESKEKELRRPSYGSMPSQCCEVSRVFYCVLMVFVLTFGVCSVLRGQVAPWVSCMCLPGGVWVWGVIRACLVWPECAPLRCGCKSEVVWGRCVLGCAAGVQWGGLGEAWSLWRYKWA